MTCDNPLNIASTPYVDCVVTTVSGHLQEQVGRILYTDFTEQVVASGTTSRSDVFSYTIPGNTLRPDKAIKITSTYLVSQGTGSAIQTLYFYGAFDSTDTVFLKPHSEAGTLSGKVTSVIYPNGQSSQRVISDAIIAPWPDEASTEDSNTSHVIDHRSYSGNMSNDVVFDLDVELSAAHSNFILIRSGVIVELV